MPLATSFKHFSLLIHIFFNNLSSMYNGPFPIQKYITNKRLIFLIFYHVPLFYYSPLCHDLSVLRSHLSKLPVTSWNCTCCLFFSSHLVQVDHSWKIKISHVSNSIYVCSCFNKKELTDCTFNWYYDWYKFMYINDFII